MSFVQSKLKNTRELVTLDKGASTVTVNREVLAYTTGGLVIPATSSTVRSAVVGICNQAIAAAESLTQVPAIAVDSNDDFIATTANNSDAAHNYQRMVLTDSLTVNNTGTDSASGVVQQVEPYGPAANKQIICRFV
jgi:hypothetical protein